MKKRAIISFCIILALIFGMCIGTVAAGGLETISAYLTYNTTIKLDGQTQTMYDANGKRVYPINYQGTTYIPIRAVSNMLDIDVNWDGATKTVLLGNNGQAKDFINDIEPYASRWSLNKCYFPSSKNHTENIAGKTYDHYIKMSSTEVLYYELGGKYETLTFRVYTEIEFADYLPIIQLVGDNDTILETVEITPYDSYASVTVDVSDVLQLRIQSNHPNSDVGQTPIYIFDATIE